MPAIDFPASPAVNDDYSFEGRTWRWNGTGWEVKEYPAALAAGSAANPSLYFTGDPNTGLYSPGADQVAISTGGTGRLFVDASGRIIFDIDLSIAPIYGLIETLYQQKNASFSVGVPGQIPFGVGPVVPPGAAFIGLGADAYNPIHLSSGSFC